MGADRGQGPSVRRSGGHTAFMWFRGLLTMPARIGDFDLSKPAVAVLNVLVDDYAEVWINGQMPRRSGYPSPATIQGLNMPNRVVLGTEVKAGDRFQLAVRLTDQCLIRSEAFGFAKPWWSFIVDEREARQGGLRAVQCGQEIMRRVAIWVRAIPRPARSATSHHPDSLSAGPHASARWLARPQP